MAEAEKQSRAFGPVGDVIGKIYQALTRDGTLAAAGRQGIDEVGMALKAFPDAIQAHEPGGIWNPTQGEIAAARGEPERLPSPSEIAKDIRPYQSEAGRGHEMTGKTWVEKENDRNESGGNTDNDQYERGKGRSLPDEQRQKEKEKEHERGGRCH